MAPVAALIPAFLSALWVGLVACLKWLVNHAHIVKIVAVCALIVAAFKVGIIAYTAICSTVTTYLNRLNDSAPHGVSTTFSLLAKVNYCVPVSETFALLAVYVSFAALCLGLKFAIASYKAIPFKNA